MYFCYNSPLSLTKNCMALIKRILATGIATVLVGGILPVTQAQNIGGSIVSLEALNATIRPGTPAEIRYRVSAGTAVNLTVNVYGMSGNTCRRDPLEIIRPAPQAAINRGVGSYSAAWNGTDNGVAVANGTYCVFIDWANPAAGVIQPLMGIIRVDSNAVGPQPGGNLPGAVAGVPLGNVGAVGDILNRLGNNFIDIIDYSPSPPVISQSGAPSTLSVRYRTTQRLPRGFSVGIYQGAQTRVAELVNITTDTPAGVTRTQTWTPGCSVAAGMYNMQFRLPGASVPTESLGNIVLQSSQCPRRDVPVDRGIGEPVFPGIDFGLPTPFITDITTTIVDSTLIVSYRILKTVNGFTLRVINPNLDEVALLRGPAQLAAGTYVDQWNFFGFQSGTYTLRFRTDRQSRDHQVFIPETNVRPPVVVPVISDFRANPSRFTKGGSTYFELTIDQAARAGITVFRDGQRIKRVLEQGLADNVSAGKNPFFWNGLDESGNPAPAGTYTAVAEARNNNGIADSRSTSFVIEEPSVGAMDVSNVRVEPLNFNPEVGNATIRFNLNQQAQVTVKIRRYNTNEDIATVAGPLTVFESGERSTVWAPGANVVAGEYYALVEARSVANGTVDSDSGRFSVVRSQQPSVMDVTNVNADPSRFNPETQYTRINYTLSHPGYVTLRITDSNGNFVADVISQQLKSAGSNQEIWYGTFGRAQQYSNYVPNGAYNIRVDATSSAWGSDYGTASVTVDRGGVAAFITITDRGAYPNPFNPRTHAETVVDFGVDPTPSSVRVELYRGSTYVKELVTDTVPTYGNNYRARWNGRDANGYIMSDDTYTYRITATAQGQSTSKSGTIYLTSSGVSNCGNFRDVPRDHPLCRAIEFVVSRGIFVGYPDGTLGVGRVIQRAELLAVMQKAFRYQLDPYSPSFDGDLGYRDLRSQVNEWYMPYVKTFARLGIMVGYPDRLMRPERTMSTAELYVVLLKSALRSPGRVANFTLPSRANYAPFADTPITDETLWYIRYAEFARIHGLVRSDKFHPGRGITRGQVIELIYDMYRKGLVNFGPAATR